MLFGNNIQHWWLNRSDVFRSIFEIVDHLDENQVYQREANLHHLRLYSNRMAQGLNSRAYALNFAPTGTVSKQVYQRAILRHRPIRHEPRYL